MSESPWSSPGDQPGEPAPPTPPPPPGWGAAAARLGAPPPGQWSAQGPGIIPLRPLSLSDIYDGAIRAVRFNPRTMIGFSALVIAVVTLIMTFPQAAIAPELADNPLLGGGSPADSVDAADVASAVRAFALSVLLPGLTFLVVTTMITALLITAVDAAVRGQKTAPGQLWAITRSRLPAVLGLALVNLLLVAVAGAALITPGVVLLVVGQVVAGVLALVIGLAVLFPLLASLLFGWWALAAPALLLERLTVFGALRRSARLVRGSFWRVLGIGLLTTVLTNIISGLIGVPLGVVGLGVTSLMHANAYLESLVSTGLSNIGSVIAGAIVYPFSAAVSALLYLDLRMRREGLDVQLMSGR